MLITRIQGWVSDKVVTRQFNQIIKFEELPRESGKTIPKFFLHISNDEQKRRFAGASRGGNGRDTTPQLIFNRAMGCGYNLAPAWDRTPSLGPLQLLSPKVLHWYSALSVGMF